MPAILGEALTPDDLITISREHLRAGVAAELFEYFSPPMSTGVSLHEETARLLVDDGIERALRLSSRAKRSQQKTPRAA